MNDKGRYHSHLVCLAAMRTLPLRSDSGKLDWIPFGRITPRSERDVSSKADSWREQPIAPGLTHDAKGISQQLIAITKRCGCYSLGIVVQSTVFNFPEADFWDFGDFKFPMMRLTR